MKKYNFSEKQLRKLASNIGREIWRKIPEISDTIEAGRWIQEMAQDEVNKLLKEEN